jgi:hypothetical protein
MSTTVDNIVLALLSLKSYFKTYLDNNGWRNKYNIVMANDLQYENLEIVLVKITNSQLALPVVILDTGTIRNSVFELGSTDGYDTVSIAIYVIASNAIELLTLGNVIRRECNDLAFKIYNYNSQRKEELSTGVLSNIILNDISNPSSSIPTEKYVCTIHATMEVPVE